MRRAPAAEPAPTAPFVALVDESERDPGGRVFLVGGDGVHLAGERLPQLRELAAMPLERVLLLGHQGPERYYAAELPAGAEPPAGLAPLGLRELHGVVGEPLWGIAGRAVQLLAWDRDHAYCGRCGTATEPVAGERARRCPHCGLTAYPRISPAVIAIVERGEELLLARGSQFPRPFYSALAGFVEPGESLEQTVRREVREEVGLELGEVRYFASQPWPFPHSLMVGFHADYAAGELVLQEDEIVDAGWFRADQLPMIPPRLSIARALIDDFRRRHGVNVSAS